jgi:hypothetical protein
MPIAGMSKNVRSIVEKTARPGSFDPARCAGLLTAQYATGLCRKTGKTKWPCADPAKSLRNY